MKTRMKTSSFLILLKLFLLLSIFDVVVSTRNGHKRKGDVSTRGFQNRVGGRRLGKGGKGKGGTDAGWTDNGYYGCLSLSGQQKYEVAHGHNKHGCDYVVHEEVKNESGNSGSGQVNMDGSNGNYASNQSGGNGQQYSSGNGNSDNSGSSNYQNEGENGNDYSDGDNGNSNNNGEGQSSNYNGDSSNGDSGNSDGNGDSSSSNSNTNGNSQAGVAQGETVTVTTMYGNVDPYDAFDITLCDTFEDLWEWDLTMSCGDSTGSSECECPFAEELISKGKLACEDTCPSDCSHVCNKCMHVLGCASPGIHLTAASSDMKTLPAAALFAFLMGFAVCFAKRKKKGSEKDSDKLGDQLMESNDSSSRLWMVPDFPDFPSLDQWASQSKIWLIPDGAGGSITGSDYSDSERNASCMSGNNLSCETLNADAKVAKRRLRGWFKSMISALKVGGSNSKNSGANTDDQSSQKSSSGVWLVPVSGNSVASATQSEGSSSNPETISDLDINTASLDEALGEGEEYTDYDESTLSDSLPSLTHGSI